MRLNPRRTFESVVDELADGLGNGTIGLSAGDEEPPVEGREEPLNLQLSSDAAFHRESPIDRFESHEDIPSHRQQTEHQSLEMRRRANSPSTSGELDVIGKGIYIKGEISGSGTLFIDGKVEGSVNLTGSPVVIGNNAQVVANITARNVTIRGKVRGDVSATDRVDIRAEGALLGDIAAARISLEDGAYFKGGIEIQKSEALAAIEDEYHVELSAREQEEIHRFA